jgi:hypothetical protein
LKRDLPNLQKMPASESARAVILTLTIGSPLSDQVKPKDRYRENSGKIISFE